jgi:hypothetical protein
VKKRLPGIGVIVQGLEELARPSRIAYPKVYINGVTKAMLSSGTTMIAHCFRAPLDEFYLRWHRLVGVFVIANSPPVRQIARASDGLTV